MASIVSVGIPACMVGTTLWTSSTGNCIKILTRTFIWFFHELKVFSSRQAKFCDVSLGVHGPVGIQIIKAHRFVLAHASTVSFKPDSIDRILIEFY